jgi:hypothetical protein
MSFLKDLITPEGIDQKVSHTRLWSNIGMAAMTAVFLRMGFFTAIPEWYAWIYATVVVAPNLVSKLITLRWGIAIKDDEEKKSSE